MMTERSAAVEARTVWLDRTTPPHIVTLVLLTGVAALNMNMVLPSLPSLAAHYSADYSVVALTVSAYLGFTTESGTEGVGRASTRSVVFSSVGIIVANVVLVRLIFFIFPKAAGG